VGIEGLLAAAGEVRPVELDALRDGIDGLGHLDLLVWDMRSRELPPEATTEAALAGARAWLESGGRMLLLSHAARYAHELGCEPVPPDRCDVRLLGDRDRYRGGLYVYGVEVADPEHPLFRGLEPYGGEGDVFLLAGEHAVRNESCFWERTVPREAEVLGTFFRNAWGEDRSFAHRCLVSLEVGSGRILALGCGPLATEGNPHRENLERFLGNAVRWLCELPEASEARPRIGLLPCLPAQLGVDTHSSHPPEPPPLPPWWEREGPILPHIAHWGWLGPIDYQRGERRSAGPDYFREQIVDESARWGANLLELYAPDMKHGFPIAWPQDDPLKPPSTYWGGDFDPLWSEEGVREIIAHAHARGMLVHGFYHPNPVKGSLEHHEIFVERTGRDHANPLLFGWERAFDGFGTEWFPVDPAARLTAALWRYNPGAYQHSTAVLPAYTPNFSGTKMCAFGRLGSLNACGYSGARRDLYHAPLYLSYLADCRTRRPSEREWGGWSRYGGGSYPDWILRQVNDFCRDRLELDSAIWWLGEPESTLHPEYRDYVYGISMDPIRCAVACSLTATGRGGYREVIASLSADPPPGFASGPTDPFDAAILQNGDLRLVRCAERDGGRLLCDPARLARFEPTLDGIERAVELLRDFPPPIEAAVEDQRIEELVLSLGTEEGLPPGEFEPSFEISKAGLLPLRIACEASPDWPQRLVLSFDASVGRHRLRIGALGGAEPGLVEVRLDGRPVGIYATGDREARAAGGSFVEEIELGIVNPGPHEIELDVQSGPGHELDLVQVHRTSRWAIRHTFPRKAGVVAALHEIAAWETPEGVRREHREFELIADHPVLRVEIEGSSGRVEDGWPLEALGLVEPGEVRRTAEGLLVRSDAAGSWLAIREELARDGAWRGSLGVFDDLPDAESFLRGDPLPEVRVVVGSARSFTLTSPYPLRDFLCEADATGTAWWIERGAQQSRGQALLKKYHRPGAPSQVRGCAFLPNGFAPGWGCQHALAIAAGSPRGSCAVRVVKTGPFLFAPRLEFEEEISAIRLDGRDWRYFEDGLVFLPNRPGNYRLTVETDGDRAPILTRTFLTVTDCRWNGELGELRISTSPPSWFDRPLPGGEAYTALVRTFGHRLIEVRGAEAIELSSYPMRSEVDRARMAERGLVLRLQPGEAVLRFER